MILQNLNGFYYEFLNYLKELDFNKFKTKTPITAQNYKSLDRNKDDSKVELPDSDLLEISKYIKILSQPKYKKFLDKIEIPNRPEKPANLEENSPELEEYNQKLQEADLTIRLMVYIKELVNISLTYSNHDTRNYYTYLCTLILLSYVRKRPGEKVSIHFRFKSPKGIILKSAKNIILNSTFERNPETGKDTLKFKPMSDTFGAKIISSKGYNPYASKDPEISKLIDIRNKYAQKAQRYELFQEELENSISTCTNEQFFNTYTDLLKDIIKLIDPREKNLIESLTSKISEIEGIMEDLDATSDLSSPIEKSILKTYDFENMLSNFKNRLRSPLALAGLKKTLNKIFNSNSKGASIDDIIENSTLKKFNVSVFQIEDKHTSSGHEAVHFDIITPFGTFEFQAQDESQYISDQIGETNAHMLMDNKEVPFFKIPRTYASISPDENIEDFILDEDSNSYFKKSEIQNYKDLVELYTAKKGKILFNTNTRLCRNKFVSIFIQLSFSCIRNSY